MTTLFRLLSQVCGLSHREAADFLSVRLDTVKSWSSGRNPTPPGVLNELAALAERIDAAADEGVAYQNFITSYSVTPAVIKELDGVPEAIELELAADDAEAQSLGWPCVGAHRAVLALTVARGMAEGHSFTVRE